MTKELNFLHSNTSEVSIVYNMKQQEKVEFQYLKFVDFKDLQSWDPKKYHKKENDLSGQVLFGEILSKRDIKWVKIEKDLEYPILGVRTYGKGVYLNRVSKGRDLKMKKYQIVEENDLFWCKVDTKNGALGIVESDLAGSFGSTNMNVAKIDIQKIFPEYLQLLFSLPRFQQYLDSFITGTTNRKYISFDRLLNEVYLPLPTLETQKKLVENYQNKITQAEKNKAKVSDLEKQIETYLMDELGIVIVEKQKQDNGYKYLQFVEFKELDRWDIDFLINSNSGIFNALKNGKHKPQFFNEIYKQAKQPFNKQKYSNDYFNYIEMGSINDNGEIEKVPKVKTIDAPSRATQFTYENDYIIGTTRPYLKKFAFIEKEHNDNICSSAFYIVKPDLTYNLKYLDLVLKSDIGIKQFEYFMTGALYPAISTSELHKLLIPHPPLEIQEKIVAQIDTWKNEIKELKDQAESLEIEAKDEFENGVFS